MTEHNGEDSIAVGHETTDAEIGVLVRFAIFLTVFCVLVAALMVGFHQYLAAREATLKRSRYPLAEGVERSLPPPPRLQTYPFADLKSLRREEQRLLDRYEWVDKKAGLVRIPVDRAIEVLAAQGLPHRTAAPQAESPDVEGKPSAQGEGGAPPAGQQPPAEGAPPQ